MANANIIQITSQNFDQEVSKSAVPVLIDFWAPWCGPCRMVAPILEGLEKKHSGKIKIGKVNVDEENSLAAQFGIRSIPTLILFKGGLSISQMIGLRSASELDSMIAKVIQ